MRRRSTSSRASAKLAYARALDADAGHVASLRALRAIAEAERDRDAYLRYLLAEARYVDGDGEKAKLLHEAGRIHQEERDDPVTAGQAHGRADADQAGVGGGPADRIPGVGSQPDGAEVRRHRRRGPTARPGGDPVERIGIPGIAGEQRAVVAEPEVGAQHAVLRRQRA